MLEGTGGGQEIMVGQYLFQHSNLFEVLIWDAGGIAFEMQRPTIAMDIKTNDHKSNKLPSNRVSFNKNILIMFENDLNINNRSDIFNSYSIYIKNSISFTHLI